jgi:AraC-like DNA-binding protein
MRYWVFFQDEECSCQGSGRGWIRATDLEQAKSLLACDDLNLVEVPDDLGFPPTATECLTWDRL